MQALDEGFTVFAGVRKKSHVDTIKDLDVNIVRIDYSSVEHIRQSLAEYGPFDYVVHNAGVTEAIDLAAYREGNVEVSKRLAIALQEGQLLRSNFVYVSSLAARGPEYKGFDAPISDYGKSKKEAEEQVINTGIDLVIVRPTAVYGSGDKAFLPLVKLLKNHIALSIGYKSQKLTFIHGADLARFIMILRDKKGEIFYAHDGKVYLQDHLTKAIKMALNRRNVIPVHIPAGLIKFVSLGINSIYNSIFKKSWHYNPSKIRELLAKDWTIDQGEKQLQQVNFKPKFSLAEGFKESVEFYRTNKWL